MSSHRNPTQALLPMLLGATIGILATRLLLPAATPAISRKKSTPPKRSIASLEKIQLGGTEQWILIRSEDVVRNPLLLILHGGPGTSELTLLRRHTQELERYFTVVIWDQRGAGKSRQALKDKHRMTIDQFVEDTRELAAYLLKRFKKQRVVLQGRSWGSALGLLTVAKYPELFSAYVGIGQISNMEASEIASYRWTLDQARSRGDEKALQELEEMGPPPYPGDWLEKFNTQRKYVSKYGGEVKGNKLGGNGKIVGSLIFSDEYTIMDRLRYNHAVQESLRLVHPQLMQLNLFYSVPRVAVPVVMVEGRHDQVVPSHLAAQYFEHLQAPAKELVWFEDCAHMPDIEEPERFHAMLIDKILPLARYHARTVKAIS